MQISDQSVHYKSSFRTASRNVTCNTDYHHKATGISTGAHGSFDGVAAGLINVDGEARDAEVILQELRKRRPNFDQNKSDVLEIIKRVDKSLHIYSDASSNAGGSEYRPPHLGTLPELNIHVNTDEESALIAGIRFKPDEILQLAKAIGGRGAVLNWVVPENGRLPAWVIEKVLKPSGYLDKVPR